MARFTHVTVQDKDTDETMQVMVGIGFEWEGEPDDGVYYYFASEAEFESAKFYDANFEFRIIKD